MKFDLQKRIFFLLLLLKFHSTPEVTSGHVTITLSTFRSDDFHPVTVLQRALSLDYGNLLYSFLIEPQGNGSINHTFPMYKWGHYKRNCVHREKVGPKSGIIIILYVKRLCIFLFSYLDLLFPLPESIPDLLAYSYFFLPH